MKYIFLIFILLTYSCSTLQIIRNNCRIEVSKTDNGNYIYCALCDSLTFNKILNNDTIRYIR